MRILACEAVPRAVPLDRCGHPRPPAGRPSRGPAVHRLKLVPPWPARSTVIE